MIMVLHIRSDLMIEIFSRSENRAINGQKI